MKIAVVVVNYKTPLLVIDCIKSLIDERKSGLDLDVFVGDADSQDGSVDAITAFIEENKIDWATCFDIGRNGGFAFGNNYIVQNHVFPSKDYSHVHFLNPDAYIHPGAVRALVDFLDANGQAGVAGSRLENPDGSLRAYGFYFPTPSREFFRGARVGLFDRLFPKMAIKIPNLLQTKEVDWVTGASFMMPRGVLERVGLMDDRYFLYFEESDLMYRVRKAGYQVWHVAESRVVHLAGQATGVRPNDRTALALPPYWYHSRFKFFHDQYGKSGAILANLSFLAGDIVYRIGRVLRFKPILDPPNLFSDFIKHGFSLPPGHRP